MILEVLALTAPSIIVIAIFMYKMKSESHSNPTAKKTQSRTVAHIHHDDALERLVGLRENNADKTVEEMRTKVEETLKRMKELKVKP